MTATPPSADRPRQAAPRAPARRRPLLCPRRWGSPLTAGLALVLVAPPVPSARADTARAPDAATDGGDGGRPPASGSVGVEGRRAEGAAGTFEDQPPAAAQDPTGTGHTSAPWTARTADGEGTGPWHLPTGGKDSQDPASLAVAEHRQEGQAPADRSPERGPGDPLGEAAQLTQRLAAGPGCTGAGGCPPGTASPPRG